MIKGRKEQAINKGDVFHKEYLLKAKQSYTKVSQIDWHPHHPIS